MSSPLDEGGTPSRAVRVLWIADTLRGAWRDARLGAFLEAADPSRIRIDLLTIGGEGDRALEAELRKHSVSVHPLGAGSRVGPFRLLRLLRRVRSGYDLVHAHQPRACYWGALASRLTRVPVVGTLYGQDPDEDGAADLHPEPDERERQATRALARWSRRVVAISRAQWDGYIAEAVFPRALVDVVYQGVETRPVRSDRQEDRAWLRSKAAFPREALVAATWTSFDDWGNGVDTVLSAIPLVVRESPQARFVFAGEGRHRSELERRVRAKGLNQFVHWAAPEDPVDRIFSGADLFIHPSLRDPFPREALEAMAARLPVVGTRVGGVPEIVGSAAVGRLVSRGNYDALARAVAELFRDPEKLAPMGEAARKRVVDEFSARQWVEEMEDVYRSVVREVRMGRPQREWSYARLSVELLKRPA